MTSIDIRRRSDCRLCGSTDLACALTLPETPPANAFVTASDLAKPQAHYPLDLWMCRSCAHLQLLDVVSPEILFREYVYVSGTSPSTVRSFVDYAADCIARFAPLKGALIVDVGSNDGTLLECFRPWGLRVLGIDPARAIARAATARGLETWPDFLNADVARRVLVERGPAALVTANNVFAHVDDIVGFTSSVREILAPDGVFVFEVSYAGDVLNYILFDTIYHEHLDYHSVMPLVPFFARNGMELFAVKRVPTHGGSIRCFVQRADGPHAADGSVAAIVAHEHARGVDRIESWHALSEHIDVLGENLRSLLIRLKSEGRHIAGFGAPAKATTLMYRFGLGSDFLDYIVDDSPLKQGLFTPGRHIPVVSWEATRTRWPDYIVILAWNFAETIIERHHQYLGAGGHFIVPLPYLKIV